MSPRWSTRCYISKWIQWECYEFPMPRLTDFTRPRQGNDVKFCSSHSILDLSMICQWSFGSIAISFQGTPQDTEGWSVAYSTKSHATCRTTGHDHVLIFTRQLCNICMPFLVSMELEASTVQRSAHEKIWASSPSQVANSRSRCVAIYVGVFPSLQDKEDTEKATAFKQLGSQFKGGCRMQNFLTAEDVGSTNSSCPLTKSGKGVDSCIWIRALCMWYWHTLTRKFKRTPATISKYPLSFNTQDEVDKDSKAHSPHWCHLCWLVVFIAFENKPELEIYRNWPARPSTSL